MLVATTCTVLVCLILVGQCLRESRRLLFPSQKRVVARCLRQHHPLPRGWLWAINRTRPRRRTWCASRSSPRWWHSADYRTFTRLFQRPRASSRRHLRLRVRLQQTLCRRQCQSGTRQHPHLPRAPQRPSAPRAPLRSHPVILPTPFPLRLPSFNPHRLPSFHHHRLPSFHHHRHRHLPRRTDDLPFLYHQLVVVRRLLRYVLSCSLHTYVVYL